jgi:hypothetical protein
MNGMVVTGEKQSIWRKTCPIAKLSDINPNWTGPGQASTAGSQSLTTSAMAWIILFTPTVHTANAGGLSKTPNAKFEVTPSSYCQLLLWVRRWLEC